MNTSTELVAFDAKAVYELITKSIEGWVTAGAMIVAAMDGGWTAESIEKETTLPIDIVFQLERLGRRQIVPQLLISDFKAAKQMTRLPYSEQERLMRGDPIEVVVLNGGSSPDLLKLQAKDLSVEHVRQVFAGGRIRSCGEQRSWIEAERQRRAEPPKAQTPYRIKGHKIFILEPCEFDAKDIARILAEIQ